MTSALRLTGLCKAYGAVQAVNGLDLDVMTGECFGLLGPNGAGKTTTIEICEGLTAPDAGEVLVLGRRWATDARWLREQIGVSLQETQFGDKLTVAETVGLFRSFYPAGAAPTAVLEQVSLVEKRNARVAHLSGGQKQRLALACALVGDPELLFLDEPTTGLDPQSRRQLWDLITRFKAEGRTIVLTTHYMDEAEQLCDRVAIVDHGKIIALGTPRELIGLVGSEHVVEFRLDHAVADPAKLGELPGVTRVKQVDDRYQLDVSHVHQTIPALLEYLATIKATLSDLVTHTATLEDVFVHLTGRHLRDS